MSNCTLRVKVYHPTNGVIIPGITPYHEQEFYCKIEQITKPGHCDKIVFSIELPYNYIVALRDKEVEKKEENTQKEIEQQLELLYDELDEFSSDVDYMSCEISESGKKQYHKEQIEKIKKFRCDLEKIKLEFGETIW